MKIVYSRNLKMSRLIFLQIMMILLLFGKRSILLKNVNFMKSISIKTVSWIINTKIFSYTIIKNCYIHFLLKEKYYVE